MKPNIFSVHSYKGGVGKTTIALTLTAVIAQKAKKNEKVCLIDLDFVGPSIESIHISQLNDHVKRLHLPYWFDPSSGSPPSEPDNILNYIWQPKMTKYQKSYLKNKIHLLLCPPTSLGIEAMERAYLTHSIHETRERFQDLFDRLSELGYKYIIIDNAPGFRDYSLTVWSMLSGMGTYAHRIIVSSPDYGDIGGIMYQIDSLIDPLDLKQENNIWWIVNFLHVECASKTKDYKSLIRLAQLIETNKISPQSQTKIAATLLDQLCYLYVGYDPRLAKLFFVRKKHLDWFNAIQHSLFNDIAENIVARFI